MSARRCVVTRYRAADLRVEADRRLGAGGLSVAPGRQPVHRDREPVVHCDGRERRRRTAQTAAASVDRRQRGELSVRDEAVLAAYKFGC